MTNRAASRSLSRWLAMFAILLKIVLAPGTMLAATPAGGLMVTLCTSDGLASGWISADGKLHRDAPGKAHHEDTPCAFSALSAAALDAGLLPPSLVPPARATLAHAMLALRPGAGLAAPPPPATGPPLTL